MEIAKSFERLKGKVGSRHLPLSLPSGTKPPGSLLGSGTSRGQEWAAGGTGKPTHPAGNRSWSSGAKRSPQAQASESSSLAVGGRTLASLGREISGPWTAHRASAAQRGSPSSFWGTWGGRRLSGAAGARLPEENAGLFHQGLEAPARPGLVERERPGQRPRVFWAQPV